MRTKEKEEVDFCLVRDEEAELMIEAKTRYREVPSTLSRFHGKYGIPAVLLAKEVKREQDVSGVSVRRAEGFLSGLFL